MIGGYLLGAVCSSFSQDRRGVAAPESSRDGRYSKRSLHCETGEQAQHVELAPGRQQWLKTSIMANQ